MTIQNIQGGFNPYLTPTQTQNQTQNQKIVLPEEEVGTENDSFEFSSKAIELAKGQPEAPDVIQGVVSPPNDPPPNPGSDK